VTLSGKLFQTLAPAIGKARLPTVGMQAEGRNIKLIRRCRSQPLPVRHVSNASKLRRHVGRRRTVQSTKCQHGHLEDDPFWNAKPVEADQCIGDVFGSPHVEGEPGCSILNGLQTLIVADKQAVRCNHCTRLISAFH